MIAQPPVFAAESARPRTSRRWELAVAAVGAVLATVLLGGYARVIGSVDLPGFTESLYPALLGATGQSAAELSPEAAYTSARTVAGWFGFTLVGVLLCCAVGWFIARRRPERKVAGWLFFAAGLVCLVGSQFILFPVAFFFFLSAGLFALRPTSHGSQS